MLQNPHPSAKPQRGFAPTGIICPPRRCLPCTRIPVQALQTVGRLITRTRPVKPKVAEPDAAQEPPTSRKAFDDDVIRPSEYHPRQQIQHMRHTRDCPSPATAALYTWDRPAGSYSVFFNHHNPGRSRFARSMRVWRQDVGIMTPESSRFPGFSRFSIFFRRAPSNQLF